MRNSLPVAACAVHSRKKHWCIIETMKNSAISLIFICLSFLFFVPIAALGQSFGGGEELSVTLTPERPGAFQTVTVEVESSLVDLSRSTVRWFRNGKVIQAGTGEKRFTFRTDALGSVTNLGISAETLDGRIFNKDIAVRPAEVTLLWQSSSYTPPFYKGKALFPFQGTVTVAAIPFFVNEAGERFDARELVYTWKEDGTVIGDASGYGNSLFAFRGAVPMREKTITVEVATQDNALLAAAEIIVPPVAPRLLLYENHPLYGIRFERAQTSPFSLEGDEVRLSAVPYFFEILSRASRDIAYDWQANFQPLPSEKSPDITLRRVSERSGTATVSLEARHEKQSFQGDRAQLTINFSERPSFGASATEAENINAY